VSNVTRVPVAAGLFTCADEPPRLIASRHRTTGAISFPAEQATDHAEQVLLSRTGRLFTWTTQQFVPPSPPYAGDTDAGSFAPYAVGYVELPEGILIEGRLTESDPERLAIGQEMELVLVPFRTEPATDGAPGREVVTFAFAPVAAFSGDDRS
jgi:uncharacterized OB-fold protein